MSRLHADLIRLACCTALVCGGLFLFAPSAQAQYKHVPLGFSAGFQMTSNAGGNVNAPAGTLANQGYGVGLSYLTIGGHGGWRFEDNMAVIGEAHVSFHQCAVPGTVCKTGSTPIMLSVYTDFRFYFLTDSFRPYINVGVAYWQSVAFVDTNLSSFGPTVALGFEWFIPEVEEIALGLQVRYNLQLAVGNTGLDVFHGVHALFAFTTYI